MPHKEISNDLNVLIDQLNNLKSEFQAGIQNGKVFTEVKRIHLQIKELSSFIEKLQDKPELVNGLYDKQNN